MDTHLAQGQRIESHIFVLRGHRAMLDADFMFQLSVSEVDRLRSQFGEG